MSPNQSCDICGRITPEMVMNKVGIKRVPKGSVFEEKPYNYKNAMCPYADKWVRMDKGVLNCKRGFVPGPITDKCNTCQKTLPTCGQIPWRPDKKPLPKPSNYCIRAQDAYAPKTWVAPMQGTLLPKTWLPPGTEGFVIECPAYAEGDTKDEVIVIKEGYLPCPHCSSFLKGKTGVSRHVGRMHPEKLKAAKPPE